MAARLLISTSSPCVGEAEVHELVGVLGVVLPQQAVGGEGVEDAVAERVAQLGVGHAPVQRQRGDEHHVVHAGLGGELEHLLDHELADVGAAHGGKRQRHVVEGDGELHARPQQRPQGLGVARAAGRGRARMAPTGSARASTGSGGYRTRLPTGSCSSRNPSPCQNNVDGVERSTSRTKPGLGLMTRVLSWLGRVARSAVAGRAGRRRPSPRPGARPRRRGRRASSKRSSG